MLLLMHMPSVLPYVLCFYVVATSLLGPVE